MHQLNQLSPRLLVSLFVSNIDHIIMNLGKLYSLSNPYHIDYKKTEFTNNPAKCEDFCYLRILINIQHATFSFFLTELHVE